MIVDRRQPQMRWSAVLAGTALAIGLWVLLQALGMGLGLAAIDTDDAGNLGSIGVGTGIWSLLTPLIAMFLGAMLAGRLAGTRFASVGALHGSVLWALTSALGVFALISILSALTSGIVRAGTAVTSATSSVISGAAGAGGGLDPGEVMEALGLDESDILAPVNKRLREQGKPAVTADQLRRAVQDSVRRSVREGRLDREVFVQELARETALSRSDVEDLAAQLSTRYESVYGRAGSRLDELGDRAGTVVLKAADATGKVLLWAGLTFLFALGAALGGGALGARLAARDVERARTVPPTLAREPDEVTIAAP